MRFTFSFSKPAKFKPQYLWNGGLNQKSLHQIPRTLSKEHTCQVSDHSSEPVLQEVAQKLKKNSLEIRQFKVQASNTIVCKPQPLRHDISRRGSQIKLPFLHLVRFFQFYNILKNQNREFLIVDPPLALRGGGGGGGG